MGTRPDQQRPVHARLQAGRQPLIARPLSVRFPVIDRGFPIPDDDQIVFRQQAVFAERRRKVGFRMQVWTLAQALKRGIREKTGPPSFQGRRIRQPGDMLGRDPDQILLDEPVEIFAFLLVFFILQRRLRLHGWIGKTLEVTELEPQGAIHIVLQRGL